MQMAPGMSPSALSCGMSLQHGEDLSCGPFEDEEARAFYEALPDVRAVVPALLLGEAGPQGQPAAAAPQETPAGAEGDAHAGDGAVSAPVSEAGDVDMRPAEPGGEGDADDTGKGDLAASPRSVLAGESVLVLVSIPLKNRILRNWEGTWRGACLSACLSSTALMLHQRRRC